jgi:hypothetical protein
MQRTALRAAADAGSFGGGGLADGGRVRQVGSVPPPRAGYRPRQRGLLVRQGPVPERQLVRQDIHEGEHVDEELVANWIRQAAELPGENCF